ncbi:hypoxia induced protein conserved region-domain-containing protein [Phellopilus nigrolimitatus]|nr:hypoxia induced protein conserved region-domain-containing protein [Phellopilus nigrolimitatus]
MEHEEEPKQPSVFDKFARQMKKHPLIPIGMVATAGALGIAFKRMHQRDSVGYQRWLRARVLAQGLTIVAIVAAGVQEMGVGVLTGNAHPSIPPPTSAYEHKEFEKRLKEAEEAHHIESSVKSTGAGASGAGTGTENVSSVADSGPKPPGSVSRAASAPSSQSASSSWSSWLGWPKKD